MSFAMLSVSDFGGFTGQRGVVTVNVTTADFDDNVGLECPVAESNPPPQIRWLGNGNPLVEDTTTNNLLCFLDNGRYLLIRRLDTPQLNTNTSVKHATETSPTTLWSTTLVTMSSGFTRGLLTGPY